MEKKMAVQEKRRLVAHEKLLIDVIKRQAGSLKKAILEGIMNSVEAGATEIDINFLAEKSKDLKNPSPAYLSIYDNGIGIKTKKELINHFETFGQPHEEGENVIWKQFRMGRGQMFAFGKNKWRTSTFRMTVDVDNMDLDYQLEEGLNPFNGCKIDIELYQNPLDNYTILSEKSLKEEVKEQVRYVKIPVKFNNEIVSVNPENLNWDYEDKHAYYKFSDTSQLKIYNLGVFVMSKSLKETGVGGVVISKKMLKVNFARNDVDSTCPVYQEINKVVLKNKIKKSAKNYESISPDARLSLLCGLRDAEDSAYNFKGKRILRLSNNKWISWKMFIKDGRQWCFAPFGSMIADKAMQRDKVLCFDERMLEELGYDNEKQNFFDWLWSEILRDDKWHKEWFEKDLKTIKQNHIDFSEIANTFEDSYSIISYSKLKNSEKRIVDVLNNLGCWNNRKISLGISEVSDAWTNGSSYIALNRDFLNNFNLKNNFYCLRLFTILCHELAHDNDSAGTHIHGPEFYEKYYEITTNNHQWENPLFYALTFSDKINWTKIEEQKAKEEQKEKELKESLGLVCV